MLRLPVHRRRIARTLLILFSMMVVNSVVFRHAHRLASGRIVVHAHPYKPIGNSPYQPNTHTDTELYWLETVAHVVYDGPLPTFFTLVISCRLLVGLLVVYRQLLPSYVFPYYSHRGPPVL